MNALDEVSHSYSHQGNPELNQPRYTIETRDHEYVGLEMIKLFSKVCALCGEEGHTIMDCPFGSFHIRVGIVRHVELQNVVGALIDQP